jgi:lipoprotein-anchoring transpeptidase ErfK/SrfK
MKSLSLSLISLSLLFFQLAPLSSAFAQQIPEGIEPASGAVVCAPEAYLFDPGFCVPAGPSQYLTEMSKLGLTFPPRPLPAFKPDPNLAYLPFKYFHLSKEPVPIFSGIPADPNSGYSSQFPAGFVYVSYVDVVDTGKGKYIMLESGQLIPGKGERISEVSGFQGLAFRATPRNAFGWPFEQIPVKSAPGYSSPNTSEWLNPYAVIQIYDTRSVDDTDWNMIGLNQWVEARKVAQVIVNTTPPEGVTGERWIDVNLAEQTLAVYENRELIFATVIASGQEPFWTRPGTFQIFQKKETENMRNNDPSDFYYLDNVPWTMYFDGARALHGAYWRTRFGYPQSHGCINLSVGDSHWLYDWAVEGDWVYVHDPSGQTPTDPNLYPNYAY